MKDYFGEKSQQIGPSILDAFGVTISSRYGQSDELIEMMQFARILAEKQVSHFVKCVSYDSKAYLCSIELDPSVQQDDPVAEIILEAATETIGQFDWFETVQHGGSLLASYTNVGA